MHQILWEYEKMDGPKALDEIMKLLFIRCIETLISDNKVDNKIDLFYEILSQTNEYYLVEKHLANTSNLIIDLDFKNSLTPSVVYLCETKPL